MITAWTQNLTSEEEVRQFEAAVRSSKPILDRLADILKNDDTNLARREVSPSAYDNPNWAYRQAHANGYSACINNILTLLSLDLKEQNESVRPNTEQPTVPRPQ